MSTSLNRFACLIRFQFNLPAQFTLLPRSAKFAAFAALPSVALLATLAGCCGTCSDETAAAHQPQFSMVSQPATLAPTTAKPIAASVANATADAASRKPFAQEIPAAAFKFNLVPIPGSADGAIKPFYMSEKEITWEAADTYIYKIDEERGSPPPGGADAVSRPSKPYIPPDRGFGHDGYAALTMSFKNATEFCNWLSKHSGRGYRLPTEAEWEHAARAGSPSDPGAVDVKALQQIAWFEDNSDGMPHPVGTKRPNAWGLYDMLGNVQEWCATPNGKGVTRGGSYRDGAEKIKASRRETEPRAWNNSDPQIPRSKWWLADAPFVGFRIVCDSEAPAALTTPAKTAAPAQPATPVVPDGPPAPRP